MQLKNYFHLFKWIAITLSILLSFSPTVKAIQLDSSLITVRGIVVNENHQPLLATVSVKGTGRATGTNEQGVFVLKKVPADGILQITGVNLETFEVAIKGRNDLGILFAKTKIATDKAVVVEANTGYYFARPNEINGSIVVIDNKTLNQQTDPNILNRLNGVTSGLAFTTKKSNNPGSDMNITIRGVSTINGPLNPLVVLDNFIYEGNISNINPNDIESVTVLKDAAATSIYGARGGNGVIVITSKKGKLNQPLTLGFNSTISISESPDLFYFPSISSSDYIDVEQFLYQNGYYHNLINYDWYYHSPFTPALSTFIARAKGTISASDSADKINTLKKLDIRNQYNKYLYSRPVTQQYSINLSGGSEKNAYYMSAGYDRALSELSAHSDKINLRLQNTFRPFKNLQIDIGGLYAGSNYISGKPSSVLLAGKHVPYLQLADENGTFLSVPQYYSQTYTDTAGGGKLLNWRYYPLEDYKHDRLTTNTEQLIANIGINYQVTKNLKVELKYQYETQKILTSKLSDTSGFSTRDLINKFSHIDYSSGTVNYAVPIGGILRLNNAIGRSDNWRGQLNYHVLTGKNNLKLLAGAELRELAENGNSSTVFGYNKDPLTTAAVDFVNPYPTFINGSYQGIPGSPTLTSTTNRFVSLYSNVSYLYNGKYSLSGSVRKDGANVFGANTNEKWKPLWSAGAGWMISKEGFYHWELLPYLRLRATLGVSGNIDLTKIPLPIGRYSQDPTTNFPLTRIMSINNPDLRWEQSRQTNLGLEFSSSKQVISGSIDFYIKKGSDLYGPSPYDYTAFGSGNTIVKNVASIKGHGIDLNLTSKNLDRIFKWTTSLLLNYNSEKTTKYFSTESENGLSLLGGGTYITPAIGKPLYAIAALKWGGLNNEGDPQGFLDGKKSTDYASILSDVEEKGLNSGSVVYIGSASPTVFGSLINTFSWKSLAASINIGYEFGYYFTRPYLSYSSLFSYGLGTNDFANRWKQPGDENKTDVPALVYTSYPQFEYRDQFYGLAENHIAKGGNVRVNYITLSYSIQTKAIKELQFYINASNLGIIWRANPYWIDPDYPISMPPSAIYSGGIRASF